MTEPEKLPPGVLPTRPVLGGFHPDPTVCRVDDVFYLACSSFEYAPGIPLFRSSDLLTWERIGSVMDRPSQLELSDAAPSGGVYAPTLRHHDGTFFLVTTNVSDGPGHLLMTATDPAGAWSDPVRVRGAGGVDPDIAWDEDGRCLLTWADGGIRQAPLDPGTGDLLSEPRPLWSGTGGRDPEAPHLYRVGRWWYLVIAEGGTGAGHAATVARAPSPTGPFEPCPHQPLLTARGGPGPVQNTGHADLVERPDGSWAMVFLGVRPSGSFPGWHVLGRETFAAEVAWRDGWPVVAGPVEPEETPAVRTPLGDGVIGADWVGAGVFPERALRWSRGRWRMSARGAEPVFVGHRQEHTTMTVRAGIDAHEGTGALEVRVDPVHRFALEVDGARVSAVARVGPLTTVLGEAPATADTVLELRVVRPTAPEHSRERGPDVVVAAVRTPERTVELARMDGRYLSTETAGGFTGRMAGVSCASGEIDVRFVEYLGGA
ncbi:MULTISPECIES: glycoside hydrolase family 43 protein [Nocardiopsis]|uniref:Glycoside hydrolase n=1 Tax=Nocardiopsis sinuspersici TaxID=501010 RepID=A0A1V3BYR0_9ACTN|nr:MULTISPECIES: glycoside hydrolase family 43 protein [Nocardiopsis]OOC53687.1 glycoside hydrolase [Nocardiopsis sinuspersici]